MTDGLNRCRVVVLGAGYAGLPIAQRMARRLRKEDAQMTLVSQSPKFVERPRLHQVATGQRVADLPLAALLKGTGAGLLVGRVQAVDLAGRQVRVEAATGPVVLHYDKLVYALGSTIDLDQTPGVREHAYSLSSVRAAGQLRDKAAQLAADGGTLVVCGGGLTGIETAAEFAEAYPDLKVCLVTRGAPGDWLPQAGRDYLRRAFERLGVQVTTGAEVAEVRRGMLALADGRQIEFDACVWSGGFAVPPLAQEAGLAVNQRGRMLVDEQCRSISHPDVYGAGDAAAIAGRWGDEITYGCRNHTFTNAYIADKVAALLTGGRAAGLWFRYIHQCISLGRRDAWVQFVHANNESPSRFYLTGRAAVRYKEFTLASAIWGFRRPGPYLPHRRRSVSHTWSASAREVGTRAV